MFEWDARKAAANLRKHGVSFDEAATVFADADGLDGPDLRHSDRIISARRASRKERQAYGGGAAH